MPATLTATCVCDHCTCNKSLAEFSVFDGICLECYEAKFVVCERCGELVPKTGRHEWSSNRAHTFEGMTVCYRCQDVLRWGSPCDWRPTPLDISFATYDKIGSTRKFGVEIETASCDNYVELHGRTPFGAKDDCTVNGKEFDSPVLYGDEGLGIIRNFLAFGEDNGWYADSHCGCHTHYDVRDLNYEQLCSVAYAYRKSVAVWKALVDQERVDGDYSANYSWTCADFKRVKSENNDFGRLVRQLYTGSYEYVRLSAYMYHNTFENRMLEGTCDAELICNWIKLNCRFIDAVKDMSIEEIDRHFGRGQRQEHVGPFCELVGDDLTDFVYERGRENGRPFENRV